MLPPFSTFPLWPVLQWFFVILSLSLACFHFHPLAVPWQPIPLSMLVAHMVISLSLTYGLAILSLAFFYGSDIAMMYSSTQTQLYINWILFLSFIFYPSSIPVWIPWAPWQTVVTGLSPDGRNSVRTLEAVSPCLTGTANRLNSVPGFEHQPCILGANLMPGTRRDSSVY